MRTVGFIPQLTMKNVDATTLAHYRAYVLHACYKCVFAPIKEMQKNKKGIDLFNAATRRDENFLPLFGQFLGDIVEKQMLASIMTGGTDNPCWLCIATKENMLNANVRCGCFQTFSLSLSLPIQLFVSLASKAFC
jgi:hypothetical protein